VNLVSLRFKNTVLPFTMGPRTQLVYFAGNDAYVSLRASMFFDSRVLLLN